MKYIMIAFALLVAAPALAKSAHQHILIDGFVARCIDMQDFGQRAFTIKVTEVVTGAIRLRIDNLVCINNQGQMAQIPFALSRPFGYEKNNRTLSYEYSKAQAVVLNTEATKLLQKHEINPNLSSQKVVIYSDYLGTDIFDISLQALEVIKLDKKVLDQGMTFWGSYRIRLQ